LTALGAESGMGGENSKTGGNYVVLYYSNYTTYGAKVKHKICRKLLYIKNLNGIQFAHFPFGAVFAMVPPVSRPSHHAPAELLPQYPPPRGGAKRS